MMAARTFHPDNVNKFGHFDCLVKFKVTARAIILFSAEIISDSCFYIICKAVKEIATFTYGQQVSIHALISYRLQAFLQVLSKV
jgi:hypothetical protein